MFFQKEEQYLFYFIGNSYEVKNIDAQLAERNEPRCGPLVREESCIQDSIFKSCKRIDVGGNDFETKQ